MMARKDVLFGSHHCYIGILAVLTGVFLAGSSAEATRWKDDVGVNLKGSLVTAGGVTIKFENLKTARPTYMGDRRTSSAELCLYRRGDEEMVDYVVDLRQIKSIAFLEPQKLRTLSGQTGSYVKVKITYIDGQNEISHAGQYDHFRYYPVTAPSQEIKADFMNIRTIVFAQEKPSRGNLEAIKKDIRNLDKEEKSQLLLWLQEEVKEQK